MTVGIEVEKYTSADAFAYLAANGCTETMVRAYSPLGRIDPNFASHATSARRAGLSADAVAQISFQASPTSPADVAQYIKGHQLTVDTLWLAPGDPTIYMSSDQADNRTQLTDLVAGYQAAGLTVGIYTTATSWQQAYGDDFTSFSALPLLYAHYDGLQTFDGFTPFGGWTTPARKAYRSKDTRCGVTLASYTWRP